MPGNLYFGESAGGRIIRGGIGFAQVGDPYQLELSTWDDRPFGEDGEGILRWMTAIVRHTQGFAVQLTPFADGLPVGPFTFSAGAPPGTDALARLTCQPKVRCNRIGAILQTTQLIGPVEFVDIIYGYKLIRMGQ